MRDLDTDLSNFRVRFLIFYYLSVSLISSLVMAGFFLFANSGLVIRPDPLVAILFAHCRTASEWTA
jgi:hypothetical protein